MTDDDKKHEGWNHPRWPNPPGILPKTPGLYWVSAYGNVLEASIFTSTHLQCGTDLRVCIWFPSGAVWKTYDDIPWAEFYANADMLYCAWKTRAIPSGHMATADEPSSGEYVARIARAQAAIVRNEPTDLISEILDGEHSHLPEEF